LQTWHLCWPKKASPAADVISRTLGVSSMQHDDPSRGFSYKMAGRSTMRMDPSRGESGV
jgi:16S rRNA (cytosine1402-N4)-methyltransferase